VDGHRLERHQDHAREAQVPGVLLLFAWLPFIVRAVQMYVAAPTSQQASMLAATPDTFRQFLEQQGLFTFFITIFTGAGLIANDLRANALQIYLSKPLTRGSSTSPASSPSSPRFPVAGHLGAGDDAARSSRSCFAGNLARSSEGEPVPAAGDHSWRRASQTIVLCVVMLALSSLSKSARFVGIMYAGHDVLHPRAVRRRLRGDAQHEVLLDVAPGPTCRPWETWYSGSSRGTTRRRG
jgi:hypothetical protein